MPNALTVIKSFIRSVLLSRTRTAALASVPKNVKKNTKQEEKPYAKTIFLFTSASTAAKNSMENTTHFVPKTATKKREKTVGNRCLNEKSLFPANSAAMLLKQANNRPHLFAPLVREKINGFVKNSRNSCLNKREKMS